MADFGDAAADWIGNLIMNKLIEQSTQLAEKLASWIASNAKDCISEALNLGSDSESFKTQLAAQSDLTDGEAQTTYISLKSMIAQGISPMQALMEMKRAAQEEGLNPSSVRLSQEPTEIGGVLHNPGEAMSVEYEDYDAWRLGNAQHRVNCALSGVDVDPARLDTGQHIHAQGFGSLDPAQRAEFLADLKESARQAGLSPDVVTASASEEGKLLGDASIRYQSAEDAAAISALGRTCAKWSAEGRRISLARSTVAAKDLAVPHDELLRDAESLRDELALRGFPDVELTAGPEMIPAAYGDGEVAVPHHARIEYRADVGAMERAGKTREELEKAVEEWKQTLDENRAREMARRDKERGRTFQDNLKRLKKAEQVIEQNPRYSRGKKMPAPAKEEQAPEATREVQR
jgi:hypothetical protein